MPLSISYIAIERNSPPPECWGSWRRRFRRVWGEVPALKGERDVWSFVVATATAMMTKTNAPGLLQTFVRRSFVIKKICVCLFIYKYSKSIILPVGEFETESNGDDECL